MGGKGVGRYILKSKKPHRTTYYEYMVNLGLITPNQCLSIFYINTDSRKLKKDTFQIFF